MQNLTYYKCLCCSKNFKVTKLIEISSSSVIIGEENLSFSNLFLDVCLQKVLF